MNHSHIIPPLSFSWTISQFLEVILEAILIAQQRRDPSLSRSTPTTTYSPIVLGQLGRRLHRTARKRFTSLATISRTTRRGHLNPNTRPSHLLHTHFTVTRQLRRRQISVRSDPTIRNLTPDRIPGSFNNTRGAARNLLRDIFHLFNRNQINRKVEPHLPKHTHAILVHQMPLPHPRCLHSHLQMHRPLYIPNIKDYLVPTPVSFPFPQATGLTVAKSS